MSRSVATGPDDKTGPLRERCERLADAGWGSTGIRGDAARAYARQRLILTDIAAIGADGSVTATRGYPTSHLLRMAQVRAA